MKSGDTVLVISNNTTMLVNITVDDRNISFIKPGMTVELSDYNGATFLGTVTSINMGGAESSNGMTKYPVTLTVDNADGSLYEARAQLLLRHQPVGKLHRHPLQRRHQHQR